jgi:hypothetical protein
MMSGCGNIQKLIEPKVIEKTVEVPAKFSWKDEFTGKRLAVKAVGIATAGAFAFITYSYGMNKGYKHFEDKLKQTERDNRILVQSLSAARDQINNMHAIQNQIQLNNVALEQRYQAALHQIQELGQ